MWYVIPARELFRSFDAPHPHGYHIMEILLLGTLHIICKDADITMIINRTNTWSVGIIFLGSSQWGYCERGYISSYDGNNAPFILVTDLAFACMYYLCCLDVNQKRDNLYQSGHIVQKHDKCTSCVPISWNRQPLIHVNSLWPNQYDHDGLLKDIENISISCAHYEPLLNTSKMNNETNSPNTNCWPSEQTKNDIID